MPTFSQRLRALARKPALQGFVITFAVLLVLREYGAIDFYFSTSVTVPLRKIVEHDLVAAPLSLAERTARHAWTALPMPDRPELTIYYLESRHDPWTRWVPLVKSGQTQIARPFFVARGDTRVLAGEVRWTVDHVVFGSASARNYELGATPKQPKEFLDGVGEALKKTKAVATQE